MAASVLLFPWLYRFNSLFSHMTMNNPIVQIIGFMCIRSRERTFIYACMAKAEIIWL